MDSCGNASPARALLENCVGNLLRNAYDKWSIPLFDVRKQQESSLQYRLEQAWSSASAGVRSTRFWSCVVLLFVLLLLLYGRKTHNHDRAVLIQFKQQLTTNNSPAGVNGSVVLSSWNDSTDLCSGSWQGVTCDGSNSGVEKLELISLGLSGQLVDSLGNLRGLVTLDLSNNGFFGSIPAGLSNTKLLSSLLLSQNNLTGPVPPNLGKLQSLHVLDLSESGSRALCLRGLLISRILSRSSST